MSFTFWGVYFLSKLVDFFLDENVSSPESPIVLPMFLPSFQLILNYNDEVSVATSLLKLKIKKVLR